MIKDELRTISQLAEATGYPEQRIRAWIRAGKLNAINLSCGSVPRYAVRMQDWELFMTPALK